jgi:hypothetical protein
LRDAFNSPPYQLDVGYERLIYAKGSNTRRAGSASAAARQLANATKTTAQLDTITPRWLIRMLQWSPVEAGICRLNRVVDPESVEVACPPRDESELPTTYVGYDQSAREIFLNSAATVIDIHTRISDLYTSPYDQIAEQLRLTIETVKERQESELINNADWPFVDQPRHHRVGLAKLRTRSPQPGTAARALAACARFTYPIVCRPRVVLPISGCAGHDGSGQGYGSLSLGLRAAGSDRNRCPAHARGRRSPTPGMRCYGWTGPLGPLSRRNDCMIWNVVV